MGTQFRKKLTNAEFHWPVSAEWTPWVNESEFAAVWAVDMLLVTVWAMNVLVLYHFVHIFFYHTIIADTLLSIPNATKATKQSEYSFISFSTRMDV